jgi:hypothetical protein
MAIDSKVNCEICSRRPDAVPFAAHEGAMARMERSNRRLWVIILVLVVLLAGSNAAWIYYGSQFVDEVTEIDQEVDTGEGDAFVSGTGDVIYGESETKGNEANPNP